jgi:hypothetical protein
MMNITGKKLLAVIFVGTGLAIGLWRCEISAIFTIIGCAIKSWDDHDNDHDDDHPTRMRFSL